MLIIFAIHIKVANYQRIYKRYKIAIFKYCPGHTKTKPQLIVNRLRFFIFVLFAPPLAPLVTLTARPHPRPAPGQQGPAHSDSRRKGA